MSIDVLLGTMMSQEEGGLMSHLRTLRQALTERALRNELALPGRRTLTHKAQAMVCALGSLDRGRIALTRSSIESAVKMAERLIGGLDRPLIHAHDALFAAEAHRLDRPLVLTVHGPLSREVRMMGKGSPAYVSFIEAQELAAYRAAQVIIAVDSGQKDIIVHDFGIEASKVQVIFNAVDTYAFAPRPPEPVPPYFLVPRRLVKKNGVHVAIAATAHVPGVELWVAGDGPELESLRVQAASLRIDERVRFLGAVPSGRISSLMGNAAGVMVPSVPVEGVIEASSIAALEAMATSRPVVASRIGGLAELIQDNVTGLLFEAGDADALATAMRRLLGDETLRARLGANARAHVVAHHGHAAWAARILSVYEQALRPSHPMTGR